tara:strand:- start:293 stop:484 length:192 start_codon:yes stop_codon:yes gene_type:complete
MKLYNIFYTYGGAVYEYEATTDNFGRWLGEHNKQRVADGELLESADEFSVEEITPIIYNKESK